MCTNPSAQALLDFAANYEKIHGRIERPGESAEYWRGADDATEFAIASIRAHADFLKNGHGD